MLLFFKENCKNGQNCPFSHNRKLMSLISLQKFIAKTLSFLHLERGHGRRGGRGGRGRRKERGVIINANNCNIFNN